MPHPADAVIDAILATVSRRQPGTRPIHAPGIAATGWFQGSAVAPIFTDADHFRGARVPVTVRFSSGSGSPSELEGAPLVLGMAVKFHLGAVTRDERGVLCSAVETDLVSVTMPSFFVATVDRFHELIQAAARHPAPRRLSWPRVTKPLGSLLRTLRMEPDLGRLQPAKRAALEFANRYPPARLATAAAQFLCVPESYATCAYHALHAFRLTAGERSTFARFHWEPVAGVRPAYPAPTTAERFLSDELGQRLGRGPVEFVLRIQVAEQGDDTADPTKPWPQTRRRIVMGHVHLDTLAPDQDLCGERLRFDPIRLVPGIDVSDDPILLARGEIYRRSAERRLAALGPAG